MPNGVDRVAIGMVHDWPLRYPDLFSRTVDGWLTDTALPPEIAAAELELVAERENLARPCLLAPQHSSPVYVNDLRGYAMFRAVVGDSLLTCLHRLVVINDAETPGDSRG